MTTIGLMMLALSAQTGIATAERPAPERLAPARPAPERPAPERPAPERPMVVIDEASVVKREPVPHGAIGMSTAYRISDAVPGRSMEFRKRILDPGAAIGPHPLTHDEVYYVLSGEGEVTSGREAKPLRPGMAAYLYTGATVGIRQTGKAPLALIVAYPVAAR